MSNKKSGTMSDQSNTSGLKRSYVAGASMPDANVVTSAIVAQGAGCVVGGPSPKKIKLEEKPAPNNATDNFRKYVINHKRKRMRKIKYKYREHLTELFYLQGGGNLVEFNSWKKTPTQPLLQFLEGSKLDSEDDDDLVEKEKGITEEVKVLASADGSLSTSISSVQPSSSSSQGQQGSTVTTSLTTPLATPELKQQLPGKIFDVKPNIHALKNGSPTGLQISSKGIKSSNSSPVRGRQSISSVYETVTGGSQDIIVERAKQEAQVIQRVTELRKEGLWSAKRLPRVQEPPRQKAHWDYLLEEMTWLAADFIQERKWKKAAAKKIARMVSNHFKEQEQKELRAEKEEAIKLKKIASQMAKMVKEFWSDIEKVVQYKQTTRLDEKKKKALDLHLSFIVDQTEKYSSWLTAGLQEGSAPSSIASDGESYLDSGDVEFKPVGSASDDEETIAKEEIESGIDEDATKKEIEALQMESELPLEDLLKSLPKEMLEKPSSELPFDDDSSDDSASSLGKDGDFKVEEDEEDAEETIAEQEKHENKNYSNELSDLKAEGEMSVEELMKKYAGAYDSDFEVPAESSGEEEDSDDGSSESDKETGESSSDDDEEEEEEEEMPSCSESKESKPEGSQEDMGLDFLVKKDGEQKKIEESDKDGPGQEYNDIAAAAQSLQPKGYTLETTEVRTKVPFLLKHSLREYQHVGLDWLATMYDKRLNGILADEMGLGKTIQTIALLAHLACDKGIWGPHLIVVPTSVMLNWEMELKKWCPAFKILTYYGSIKERKIKRTGWTKTNAFHVCITSYKLVVQDHQAFRRKKWKYFILDEAQNIKNFKSQRWQMLLNFSSQRRLLLTGTPLQNSLMELWSLMHFLMPNVFQSHSEFKEWFSNPLTGMVEGSQEYNESLVRRLHKVLRPFLLRRLKNEVEKQMPKKFEHVVMCRLSKRQRYLYDDFMAQSKTKETLSTGHFMSVINILMQLRKVCNHPNLFDPRPIVSPFKMEGIVYRTASLATKILDHDPFKDIDIYSLYPNLLDMETDLPAFVSQRVKQVKASGKLIEEVDDIEDVTRPPAGHLKNVRGAATAFAQTGKMNPSQSISVSSLAEGKEGHGQSQSSNVSSVKLLLPPSSTTSTGAQQTILIPNPSGSGPPLILPISGSSITSSSSSSTSAAIASAKLISSQLQSGMLQVIQTSSGHQILTTASTTSSSAPISSPVATASSANSNTSLLKLSSASSQSKPVMRVSPFVVSTSETTTSTVHSKSSTPVISTSSTNKLSSSYVRKIPKKPMKRSELFLESLFRRRQERRQHVLSHMAKLNKVRCDATPIFGPDVHQSVNCVGSLNSCDNHSSPLSSFTNSVDKNNQLKSASTAGYVNCLFAQDRCRDHNRPDLFWKETKYLQDLVKSPEEWFKHLEDILARFVFVTPLVISPPVCIRTSYTCQSESNLKWLEAKLRPVVLDSSAMLHPIQSRTSVTFPELRLIQYDCGKLQRMDILLRQLKSGQHRVLIFTQMTKMLDVLEAFLNFHGHRYLRLDGTTRVEQRQYLMDRFNADARIFCFILSTRSGGIGVNLTGADTVIFYDSDWNPTMDAQAQDRCHRIGQTRDVHIYRLVSEMTVEENILKKANQKRLLGDLAIEGGNFTTAFFKEQTVNDLFAEPSGLQSLVEDKEKEKIEKDKAREQKEKEMAIEREKGKEEREKSNGPSGKAHKSDKDTVTMSQFEQALCKAEDETDAKSVAVVQAEQKAELAEFDENIPWDEREAEMKKEEGASRVEMELALLDKELKPIERYAVTVMEAQLRPETAEELQMAEEDIENSKKGWELARLKALKEEEERKAELEDDEMLYIYSKDDSQVKKKGRKPLKNKPKPQSPKGRGGKGVLSGSDDEDYVCKSLNNSRRISERSSPQKVSPKPNVKRSRSLDKKKKEGKGTRTGKPGRPKKTPIPDVPQKKVQNVPKPKDKNVTKIVNGETPPTGKSKLKVPKVIINGMPKEKKAKNAKNPVHLQNGHSVPPISPGKLATQKKNALLKQQAQQAAHITISPSPNVATANVPLKQKLAASSILVNTNLNPQSPQSQRPQLKTSTPKSPVVDPNVPPPWSNPNLVIRTRKAAVHSPVVISKARTSQPQQMPQYVFQQPVHRPQLVTTLPISAVSGGTNKLQTTIPVSGNLAQIQSLPISGGNSIQLQTSPVQIQSSPIQIQASPVKIQASPLKIQASPVKIQASSLIGGINKVQGAPDRNIFQIFQANTPGVSSLGGIAQNVRHFGPVGVGNQIRTATLINPATIGNLTGGRFFTTGLAGQTPVVVSAPKPNTPVNVGSSVSNITIMPSILNASGGQRIITPSSGATIVNLPGGARQVLNTTRLTNPISLQGLNLPLAVNLMKNNTAGGMSSQTTVRPQQLLQTSQLAQVAGQPGYFLISPRGARPQTPAGASVNPPAAGSLQRLPTPISIVQTLPVQNSSGRVLLAQMPAGAKIVQAPHIIKTTNPITSPPQPKADGP